jgi:hypothetical protein
LQFICSRFLSEREKAIELKDFHAAVEMVEKDLFKILGKHGVERFQPENGHDFTPTHHEVSLLFFVLLGVLLNSCISGYLRCTND